MIVVGVSDIHCSGNRVADLVSRLPALHADLVLVAGDIECDEPIDLLAESGTPFYAVTGNMDDIYVRRYIEGYGALLDGRVVEHEGFLIAGIGASMYREDYKKITRRLEEAWDKPLIIVSHYPAYGYNDRVYTGKHIGIRRFIDLIDKHHPILFLHGHVHEDRGVSRRNGTLIVNPGPLMHGYYAVINLEPHRAEARLEKL